jgi:hypothetical protein
MVRAFPLDYMHVVCLGVMKRLLRITIKGQGDRKEHRLSWQQLGVISAEIIRVRGSIPVPQIFVRKPRRLDDFDRFKASEFRQLLLYTGKVVFKNVWPPEKFEHFLCLSVAVCILVSPALQTYASMPMNF